MVKQKLKELSRTSIIVTIFSTAVEWYDFTLYLYFASVLSRVFFGGGETSLLIILAGFAISYIMRPLGAIFFGHIGDKYGRRQMLLISMTIMSLAMLATALLPTYQHGVPISGIALLLLRCLMAFSVGGEYNGVMAYLLEGTKHKQRGLLTSLASAASEIGALLSVGVCLLTVNLTSAEELNSWGWRIPFLLGAFLAGGIWFARTNMQESPAFEHHQQKEKFVRSPLRHTLAYHRLAIARTFAISALASITYYVGIVYIPAYLSSGGLFSEKSALEVSTIAALAVIVVTPFIGALSDYLGRKPVLVFLSLTSVILPFTMFSLMSTNSHAITLFSVIVLGCLAGGTSAVGASSSAEQFPIEGRLSGLALGNTTATTLLGGLTPYLAQTLIDRTGSMLIPGIMISIVALCVLPVFIFMPETAPHKSN